MCRKLQFELLHVLNHETWKAVDTVTDGFLRQFDGVPIGLTCTEVKTYKALKILLIARTLLHMRYTSKILKYIHQKIYSSKNPDDYISRARTRAAF